MKKQLLALSLLAAFAGMAHAQSNVTIYGLMDTGFIKETGSDLKMGEWNSSRLGFKGTEDLGSGYKATFQLEKRFYVNDGAKNGDLEFEGASNVGLAGPFGAVRLGRINEIATESFRRLDPFNQEGVGSIWAASVPAVSAMPPVTTLRLLTDSNFPQPITLARTPGIQAITL